jgi:RND family efflux transporter MFP subunit
MVGADRSREGTTDVTSRLVNGATDFMATQKEFSNHQPGPRFYLGWLGFVALVLIGLAVLLITRSVSLSRQTDRLRDEAAQGPLVLVAQVAHQPDRREVTLPGDVHGFFETPVYAKVPGYLKSVMVDKGARVKAGQLLAIVDSPETDQQVVNAKADLDFRVIENRRFNDMVLYDAASQEQTDQARANYLQAQATLRQMKALQGYERVTSPYDGIITARNLDPGALVATAASSNSSSSPIFTLATLSPLRIYVQLPQVESPFVKDGDNATVTVQEFAGREFHGSVTRHPEALASATRTMLLEVDLPNQDRALFPGMYAHVTIKVSSTGGAALIPDQALIFNDTKVFVPIVRGGRIHLAEVTLGFDDGINCEIVKGLRGNETIALNVGQSAEEGELVRPLQPRNR